MYKCYTIYSPLSLVYHEMSTSIEKQMDRIFLLLITIQYNGSLEKLKKHAAYK